MSRPTIKTTVMVLAVVFVMYMFLRRGPDDMRELKKQTLRPLITTYDIDSDGDDGVPVYYYNPEMEQEFEVGFANHSYYAVPEPHLDDQTYQSTALVYAPNDTYFMEMLASLSFRTERRIMVIVSYSSDIELAYQTLDYFTTLERSWYVAAQITLGEKVVGIVMVHLVRDSRADLFYNVMYNRQFTQDKCPTAAVNELHSGHLVDTLNSAILFDIASADEKRMMSLDDAKGYDYGGWRDLYLPVSSCRASIVRSLIVDGTVAPLSIPKAKPPMFLTALHTGYLLRPNYQTRIYASVRIEELFGTAEYTGEDDYEFDSMPSCATIVIPNNDRFITKNMRSILQMMPKDITNLFILAQQDKVQAIQSKVSDTHKIHHLGEHDLSAVPPAPKAIAADRIVHGRVVQSELIIASRCEYLIGPLSSPLAQLIMSLSLGSPHINDSGFTLTTIDTDRI
eukprot:gene12176-14251_t